MHGTPSGSSVQAGCQGSARLLDLSRNAVHAEYTRLLLQLYELCHSQQKGCKDGHASCGPAAYLLEVAVQHSLHVVIIEGGEPRLCHIDWNAIG